MYADHKPSDIWVLILEHWTFGIERVNLQNVYLLFDFHFRLLEFGQ